ncbi:hypothetical protein ATANTOWER_019993, partial [Ataeniobius toweri]|nr:hypothetical protein [Ataeniobius toweri]
SFPLKGSKGDKSRSLKKLSREFEISIQRYQWFLSELPEMLCESEMEVEQHTCWSGEDVVERTRRDVTFGLCWTAASLRLFDLFTSSFSSIHPPTDSFIRPSIHLFVRLFKPPFISSAL